jgi:hypothetical protein
LIVVPFFLVQFVAGLLYMNRSRLKILQAMAKSLAPRVRTTELRVGDSSGERCNRTFKTNIELG